MTQSMRIAFWSAEESRFVRELASALAREHEPHDVILLAECLHREPCGRALTLLSGWLHCRERVEKAIHRLEEHPRRLCEHLRAADRASVREALRQIRERGRWRLLLTPVFTLLAALVFVSEWAVTSLGQLVHGAWLILSFPLEPVTRLAQWVVSRNLTTATPGVDPRLAALAAVRPDVLVTTDPTFAGLDADVAVVAVVTNRCFPQGDDYLRQAARVGEHSALCVSVSPDVDIDDLCWLFHIPRGKARLLLGDQPQVWLDLFREAQRRALWQKHCLSLPAQPWPVASRPPAVPRGPREAFLFLQTHYRGGVWETVKDLMKDLAALNASKRDPLRLTLGVHEDQTDLESLADLPGVVIERFRLSPIRPLELTRLLGHELLSTEGEWGQCFFAGAAASAVRADCWLALVDRFSQPLAPLRPYGVFVYDMIQRCVPQSFSPLFFDNIPRGMRPTIQRAARVIVTSPQTRDDVIEEYGIDPAMVELIPVSCNPGRRFESVKRQHVSLPNERFILNVTNIAPHKGGEALFRAYGRLRERLGDRVPGLVVCGYGTESFLPSRPPMVDTPEIRTVRSLIQEMGLREGKDYVALGMVSDGQLLDLFQRAEVVVNAALYDNGTFSLVEAAWFGKKTVSAGYPASRYLCERYRVPARFFAPGDAIGFAEALEQALASPGMTSADVERVHTYLRDPESSSRRYAESVYKVLVDLAEAGRRQRQSAFPATPITTTNRRLAG